MPLSIDCNVGILSPRADFMINNNSNLPKAPKMRRIESRSEGQLSPCLNMRFNEDRLNMPCIRESSQDSGSSIFRGSMWRSPSTATVNSSSSTYSPGGVPVSSSSTTAAACAKTHSGGLGTEVGQFSDGADEATRQAKEAGQRSAKSLRGMCSTRVRSDRAPRTGASLPNSRAQRDRQARSTLVEESYAPEPPRLRPRPCSACSSCR